MRKVLISVVVAAAVVGSAGAALAVSGAPSAPSNARTSNTISACLTQSHTLVNVHPHRASVRCPGGDTRIKWNITGPQGSSGVLSTKTKDLGNVPSVATGGGFVANSTEVGQVQLPAGTYLVSLNAKATPNAATSGEVFPQFFVYNQVKNANFTGDLFNVGTGALEPAATNHDSYFSGSTTISLAAPTTLHVYAFGYDSDSGAGSYTLDDLTVTATRVNAG